MDLKIIRRHREGEYHTHLIEYDYRMYHGYEDQLSMKKLKKPWKYYWLCIWIMVTKKLRYMGKIEYHDKGVSLRTI